MADITSMKGLIDSIMTMLQTAQTAGDLSTNKIFRGLQTQPNYASVNEYPYIMVDDGGERTDVDNPTSTRAQNRVYDVVFQVGTWKLDSLSQAMDDVMDICNELKDVLEDETNRLGDGFLWGWEITPYGWDEETWYFRGRQIIVSYTQLEDTIDKY